MEKSVAEPAPMRRVERLVEPVADYEPVLHETGPSPRRWLWMLGSTVAILVLAVQAVLHFRVELAVLDPAARPLLEVLCDLGGCAVDLPRRVELMTIESSDLQPDPAQHGLLLLTATLRNRAPFTQTWPLLELSLTDHQDKALARRVLQPSDYLPQPPPAAGKHSGIASGEQGITVRIDSGDLGASGYRLYLFYS